MSCKDCGQDTHLGTIDYYSVPDQLWNQAKGGEGELCLGCFQARVGRPLDISDFIACPASIAAAMVVATTAMAEAAIYGRGDLPTLVGETMAFLAELRDMEIEAEMARNDLAQQVRNHRRACRP